MKKKKLTKGAMDHLQKNRKQAETEAKAELIYWATGRTKTYPEKDFTKNYTDTRARSEKKRDRENISARFGSGSKN
jgi:hypothetical protein